jgi:hypothetical protein
MLLQPFASRYARNHARSAALNGAPLMASKRGRLAKWEFAPKWEMGPLLLGKGRGWASAAALVRCQ